MLSRLASRCRFCCWRSERAAASSVGERPGFPSQQEEVAAARAREGYYLPVGARCAILRVVRHTTSTSRITRQAGRYARAHGASPRRQPTAQTPRRVCSRHRAQASVHPSVFLALTLFTPTLFTRRSSHGCRSRLSCPSHRLPPLRPEAFRPLGPPSSIRRRRARTTTMGHPAPCSGQSPLLDLGSRLSARAIPGTAELCERAHAS